MKIFIVDDNKEMQAMIASILQVDGIEIFELQDGEEAIEQYGIHHPDWVLMDIKMKRVNGLEASKIIKSKYPDARIAIVTNYDSKLYRNYAAKIGVDVFISKQNLMELQNLVYEK